MDAEQVAAISKQIIERYRTHEDLGVPGMHRERLTLLTTTGRRTGERHTAPMMFVPHGEDRVLVIASNDGAEKPPAWLLNLEDDPRVHVELPEEEWDADARVLDDDERAPVWERLVADYPFFAEQQSRTDRTIPVVELSRTTSPSDGV